MGSDDPRREEKAKDARGFATWSEQAIRDLNLEEAPLNCQVVHEIRFTLPNHKAPADRFIAGTAIAYDLTADKKLLGVPGLKVLANV